MDFSDGIPPEYRTLVVVPDDARQSERRSRNWSKRWRCAFWPIAMRNLHFGLLTDFRDAAAEVQPEDESLLRAARQGIEELNRRYRTGGGAPFFLFHRPRRWNPQERVWMGYERKRGKLGDLNALLRGGAAGCLLADRRRHRESGGREVRDHARHRHAAAARCGAADWWARWPIR